VAVALPKLQEEGGYAAAALPDLAQRVGSGNIAWAVGLVLVFVGVWRLIQDYVNTPYFMSEGLELHPLAAIFGILVGGEVFGIPGMFLSIPVIAGLRIVWHTWHDTETPEQKPAAATLIGG
jgi:predicted PurR-regulated permease PerM